MKVAAWEIRGAKKEEVGEDNRMDGRERMGDSDWMTGMQVGESMSFNEENTKNNTGKGGSQFLLRFLETDLIRKKMRIKYRQRKRPKEIFTAARTF